ncbi:pteropsin9 [Daphnia sinensis]|uniref:Pteropsin9 n=1 Tax=Daphnia sinensis TaxID=1820382 RepID=A0AAD5KNS7_9CRUS|nr:pteropsin9 [Daphnia sinensis]
MSFSTNISNSVRNFVNEMLTKQENSGDVNYFNNHTGLLRIIGTNYDSNIIAADYDGVENSTDGVNLLMPTWAYRSVAAYLLFISVLGLVMNIIVAVVILNDSRYVHTSKSKERKRIINESCALSAKNYVYYRTPVSTAAALQFGWPFSHELCVAYAMIMSTAGIGSITTLTALAVWRCQLVVCCPAKRKSTFTNHNGRLECRYGALLLILIWIYALAVTCPPLLGWGRYDREAAHISCSVNWESKRHYNRSYILYMFVMGLVIPLSLIMVSYVKILRVVREHLHRRGDAAEKRVTMMVACMIAAFMGAWTPYSILALYETFFSIDSGDNYIGNKANVSDAIRDDSDSFYVGIVSPAFATIPSLFAKTSAVLNPLIYGLLNTQFRLAWERFSLRYFSRWRHRRHPSGDAVANRQTQIKRRDIRRFRLSYNSNSRGIKPGTTVHLPMREIIFPKEDRLGQTNSKITKIPPIIDTQATHSIPVRISRNNEEEERRQQPTDNHQEQERTMGSQCYKPLHLPSALSSSLPSLSTCTSSHLVCPGVNVACQSIKKRSIRIQRHGEQLASSISVRLLSHTVHCRCSIGKSMFLNTYADADASLTAHTTITKSDSEVNQT